MEHKVSSYEERQLTNAIERAATVASVNEDLDPNNVLVQQLKKASVDPKFAETAARAFNKRLTVFNLRKTADEHKADPFDLADPDMVKKMMTGEEVKTAAVNFDMTIEQLENLEPMDKAASSQMPEVIVRDKRYEHLCSWDTFKQHLESDMDKLASALRDVQADLSQSERTIEAEAKEVVDYFKQASYGFDFTTAVNLYGDKLQKAIGHLVDKGVSFKKTAKYVVCPSKDIFKKVAKLLSDKKAYDDVEWFAQELASGMAEFAKSAADLGNEYQIKEADLAPLISTSDKNIKDLTKDIDALKSRVDDDARSGRLGQILGGGADIAVNTAAGLGNAAIGTTNAITGAMGTAWDNAMRRYYAGNNVSISPGDLLDAAFLTKDRYRDRLLAWSDMSADPQLSLYPAEQVFNATQKAMDMNTSMERPDNREALRAYVAQLLAQNNRASTADLAALASTLKELGETAPNAAMAGDAAVQALSDKAAPERVEQDKIVGQYGSTEGLKGLADASADSFNDRLKQLDTIGQRERDNRKEQLKTLISSRDSEEKNKQKLLAEQEKRDDAADTKAKEEAAKKKEYESVEGIAKRLGYVPVSKGGTTWYVYTGKASKAPIDKSYVPAGKDPKVLTLDQMQRAVNDIQDILKDPTKRIQER